MIHTQDHSPPSTSRNIGDCFVATDDLTSAYSAEQARKMGWTRASLVCVQEMAVEGSLPACIRVLVLWETDKPQSEMQHCYLRGAPGLRPDHRVDAHRGGMKGARMRLPPFIPPHPPHPPYANGRWWSQPLRTTPAIPRCSLISDVGAADSSRARMVRPKASSKKEWPS